METLTMVAETTQQPSSATAFLLPMFGALGVIVGAFITLAGQAAGRRQERRNETERIAAELAASTYVLQTIFMGLLNFHRLTPDLQSDEDLAGRTTKLNQEMRTASMHCSALIIRAPKPLLDATINLLNACVEAHDYLHPFSGTGRNDNFENSNPLILAMDEKHDELIDTARRINTATLAERVSIFWKTLSRKGNRE